MRTVSTKLDKIDHDRLLQMYNEEGQSVAEALRDMIQQYCDAHEDSKAYEEEQKQSSTSMLIPKVIIEDV